MTCTMTLKRSKRQSKGLIWYCDVIENGQRCGKLADYSHNGVKHCLRHWEIYLGFKDKKKKKAK